MFCFALVILGWKWRLLPGRKMYLACRCILYADRPGPRFTAVKSHKTCSSHKGAGRKTWHVVIYGSQLRDRSVFILLKLYYLLFEICSKYSVLLINIIYWVLCIKICVICLSKASFSLFSFHWRRKALPVLLGGLWMALRSFWWANSPFQETHRGKAFPVWSV